MSVFTVAIAGVTPDVEVYVDLPRARAYIGALFSPQAAAWLALSADDQGRTLVSATRYLDAQGWSGATTGLAGGIPTTLAFPRTGLVRNGAPVDSPTVPPEVPEATCELAVAIAAKPGLVGQLDQGSNLKSVSGGGGVGASFFAPSSAALGTATVLPVQVQRLVGRFLAVPGADGSFGAGGGRESQFSRHRQFSLLWPED
jgi:hypothetical protein